MKSVNELMIVVADSNESFNRWFQFNSSFNHLNTFIVPKTSVIDIPKAIVYQSDEPITAQMKEVKSLVSEAAKGNVDILLYATSTEVILAAELAFINEKKSIDIIYVVVKDGKGETVKRNKVYFALSVDFLKANAELDHTWFEITGHFR